LDVYEYEIKKRYVFGGVKNNIIRPTLFIIDKMVYKDRDINYIIKLYINQTFHFKPKNSLSINPYFIESKPLTEEHKVNENNIHVYNQIPIYFLNFLFLNVNNGLHFDKD